MQHVAIECWESWFSVDALITWIQSEIRCNLDLMYLQPFVRFFKLVADYIANFDECIRGYIICSWFVGWHLFWCMFCFVLLCAHHLLMLISVDQHSLLCMFQLCIVIDWSYLQSGLSDGKECQLLPTEVGDVDAYTTKMAINMSLCSDGVRSFLRLVLRIVLEEIFVWHAPNLPEQKKKKKMMMMMMEWKMIWEYARKNERGL